LPRQRNALAEDAAIDQAVGTAKQWPRDGFDVVPRRADRGWA
jgi:predicted RNA polymerase sigma factor